MRMFIFALLNVFEDMYQDLGISIQFLVQINMTVSHKRYLRRKIVDKNGILCIPDICDLFLHYHILRPENFTLKSA